MVSAWQAMIWMQRRSKPLDRSILARIWSRAPRWMSSWPPWSARVASFGALTPTINAAVESRIVSAYKEERAAASEVLIGPEPEISTDPQEVIGLVRDALYAAKICSYAQGFALMRLASKEYDYNLNYGEIARIWRGGCIIHARFLNDIRQAFTRNPDLPNLMVDLEFARTMNARQAALRKVVALAAENGIPALAFSSALAYFDAYRSVRLPANLTQAQRDYFGANTEIDYKFTPCLSRRI